jgi:glycosyltransferase domain-containing protein
MNKNDLTILLTLRGRHLHTLRWMWHANRIGLPYHVIIADGEVHPTIDRLLSDPATFQNLSFEYHRHCDQSFSDFYKKCAETIRKVKTKYVMMSDNDDVTIIAGIKKSIAYLNNEPDYVCAGGKVPDFLLVPRSELPGKIIGQMVGPRFGYQQQCRDISFSSVSERVLNEINQYQNIYYHVYRTQALRVIFEEAKVQDFTDLTVHEYFCALRTVTLGKVRSDPSVICYLRQIGTSMHFSYSKDWVHHLLRSRIPQDFNAMATVIANEVERLDNNNAGEFKESILDAYAWQLRHMLGHTMMRHRFPRLFQIKQKLLWLKKLRVTPAWYQRRLKKKNFWREFSIDCTDATLLAAYKEEFQNIETSLQGDEFQAFVKTNAPDLLCIA